MTLLGDLTTELDGHPLARLPLPPGKCPFHVKGTAFVGHLKWVEKNLPGGLEAYWKGWADDPDAIEYQKQVFLSGGWYDHFVLAKAGIVCARIMMKGFEEFIVFRARNQADQDVNGVYKFLFRVTSTKMIAGRLPIAMTQYFDHGKVDIRDQGTNHVVISVDGLPVPLASWMVASFKGFLERALELTGTKDPRFLVMGQAPSGSREGFDLLRVDCRIEWS
jgi:hypothetical protein